MNEYNLGRYPPIELYLFCHPNEMISFLEIQKMPTFSNYRHFQPSFSSVKNTTRDWLTLQQQQQTIQASLGGFATNSQPYRHQCIANCPNKCIEMERGGRKPLRLDKLLLYLGYIKKRGEAASFLHIHQLFYHKPVSNKMIRLLKNDFLVHHPQHLKILFKKDNGQQKGGIMDSDSLEMLDYPFNDLLVALNKPLGVICSTAREHNHRIVYDLFPDRFARRKPSLNPVGRLDVDSSGLILLTQDGILNHAICSSKYSIPKIYRVKIIGITPMEILQAALSVNVNSSSGYINSSSGYINSNSGYINSNSEDVNSSNGYVNSSYEDVNSKGEDGFNVSVREDVNYNVNDKHCDGSNKMIKEILLNQVFHKLTNGTLRLHQENSNCLPCELKILDYSFSHRENNDKNEAFIQERKNMMTITCEIEITEGKYHQVKRMFAAVGFRVIELKRLRIGNIDLNEIENPGEWRIIDGEEKNQLYNLIHS